MKRKIAQSDAQICKMNRFLGDTRLLWRLMIAMLFIKAIKDTNFPHPVANQETPVLQGILFMHTPSANFFFFSTYSCSPTLTQKISEHSPKLYFRKSQSDQPS
jgi:hypothetical protein